MNLFRAGLNSACNQALHPSPRCRPDLQQSQPLEPAERHRYLSMLGIRNFLLFIGWLACLVAAYIATVKAPPDYVFVPALFNFLQLFSQCIQPLGPQTSMTTMSMFRHFNTAVR